MAVPYVFSQLPNGSTIPLSHLDADFAYIENQIQDIELNLPITVLANIAALRLLAVNPSINILLNGYYTNGDGGGGYFRPVSGASSGTYVDNGGSIIVPTGGDGSSAWIRIFSGPINVKWFGAKGDGISDDISYITNAISSMSAAGGGTLFFPIGTYNISGPINITYPVCLVGAGDGLPAGGGFSASTMVEIVATASMSKMASFYGLNNGGWGIKDITFSGTTSYYPTIGVEIDGCTGGYFQNLSIIYASNLGLILKGTSATCSWNTFINLYVAQLQGTAAVQLSGNLGAGNAAHNSFITTRIAFAGSSSGIILAGCDNNSFYMTFIFDVPGATGYGVKLDPTEMTNFPWNNSFYHLQASTRGWYQPSSQLKTNSIYGYMTDNGQPAPITNNTPLYCIYDTGATIYPNLGASIGKSRGNNLTGAFNIPSGVSSYYVGLPTPEPDNGYMVLLNFNNIPPSQYSVSTAAAGFTINFLSATGGAIYTKYFIVRL